ncbi:MAG: hypothetical protein LBD46_04595 [Endomicrobium sp.]|jgi:hypothetical protein|nr:hypothetical protein [Endomicrobium sp.]
MSIKKCLSVIVCFIIFSPSFVKVVSANEVSVLCLNSTISSYYASLSKVAFKMVNVIAQDFLDMQAQTSKKEAPPKHDGKNNKDDKAIVLDNSMQKTMKTNLLSGGALSFEGAKDIYVLNITGDSHFAFTGWMILLLMMFILSVRKKDDSEVLSYYFKNTHPIL